MEFEWDPAKRERNLEKHGIDFVDAARVLMGRHVRIRSRYTEEERFLAIGMCEGRTVAVVYTMREGRYRIISARRARTHEEETYRTLFGAGR